MLRIALINMPFASAAMPSIALAQLRTRLSQVHGDRVSAEIFHFNHELASFLGPRIYLWMAGATEAVTSGLGDWFFREAAFPESAGEDDPYLTRYFAEHFEELDRFGDAVLAKRRRAREFLEGLVEKHSLLDFDMVGFTSMFSQNVASFGLARVLKERRPDMKILMGGANCETEMGRVIARNVDCVDFVFSGPALVSFPELVGHVLDGDEEACHSVRGVYSKRKLEGGGPVEIGPDLDIDHEIPLDYDDFIASLDAHFEPGTVPPMLLFETSRGCWWGERSHCTFCGLNGITMKYRGMSTELALLLIRDMFDRYASRVDRYQAVDNIMPREYLTDLFPQLEPPPNVSIFYEVKADLKEHEMEVMARAGVTKIQPGIEAIATSTLKLMRKGTTAFQNLKFLKDCLRHGIDPAWNLLVGFPGEDEEVYEKYTRDLPLLTHLPPPSGAFPVRFDRFSPYFKEADEYELDLAPCDFYEMIYPFPESDLADLAYFFTDQNHSARYSEQTARWIERLREPIRHWHRRWSGDDGGHAPRLEIRGEGDDARIHDSRSGRPVAYEIGAEADQVLRALASQRKIAHLDKALPELSAPRIESIVGVLQESGLIFQEGDLLLSLVMDDPPHPAMLGQSPGDRPRMAAPA